MFVFVFQFKKGGPIIAVQVENEYGSYSKDSNYMLFVKEVTRCLWCMPCLFINVKTLKLINYWLSSFLKALQSHGISELLLTSDKHSTLKSGGVSGGTVQIFVQAHTNRHTHVDTHAHTLSCVLLFCSHQLSKAAETEPERHPGPVCCSGLYHLMFLHLQPVQDTMCLILQVFFKFFF